MTAEAVQKLTDHELVPVVFAPKRTFGVELEVNRPDRSGLKTLLTNAGEPAQTSDYCHNRNNDHWVCKTDSSCGFEMASRVFGSMTDTSKCIADLHRLHDVVEKIQPGMQIDDRCGFHVHVCVSDFNDDQFLSLLAHWIKIEKSVLDSLPERRKSNRYCPRNSANVYGDDKVSLDNIRRKNFCERGALNLGRHSEMKTIEFRVMEGTSDPETVFCWVGLLLHFVETCKATPAPADLKWIHMPPVFRFLGLINPRGQDPERDAWAGNPKHFFVPDPTLNRIRLWWGSRIKAHANFQDKEHVKEQMGTALSRWM